MILYKCNNNDNEFFTEHQVIMKTHGSVLPNPPKFVTGGSTKGWMTEAKAEVLISLEEHHQAHIKVGKPQSLLSVVYCVCVNVNILISLYSLKNFIYKG